MAYLQKLRLIILSRLDGITLGAKGGGRVCPICSLTEPALEESGFPDKNISFLGYYQGIEGRPVGPAELNIDRVY